MRIRLICATLILLAAPLAQGAPGALDQTFGSNGIVQISAGVDEDLAHGLLVLPSGGIAVSGYGPASGDQFRVAQFTMSGQPDLSFGTGGRAIIAVGQFAPNSLPAGALLRNASGKLVVVGARTFGNCRLVITRINPDGSLDTSFGAFGVVEDSAYGGVVCSATSASLLPNASIVVAGFDCCAYDGVVLTRRLPDGSADPAFGVAGISKPANALLTGRISMVLDGLGRIIASGTSGAGLPVIRRFTAIGAQDLTFAAGGAASPAIASGAFTALVRQADQNLVAAGYSADQAMVSRFSSNGIIDVTFGNGGVVLIPAGALNPVTVVSQQADSKLVATYGGTSAGTPGLWLARFLPNGMPDIGFGTQGRVFTPLASAPTARAMTILPDGKILILVAPNLLLRFEAMGAWVAAEVPASSSWMLLALVAALGVAAWRTRAALVHP